ncbi:hypothetical protein JAAARDRAFT_440352 [Jaapia argillacea MUCL 33604]|uniref:Uncharacterized protein n=1 Tax=Jaapia argillacea MUCL 33604 TaxID=933084 RepID=A0A067PRM3_9AGAM|nr:hypothetical protein JAAARDRAFT_440352 [Jaapia argillacea MUCL 33604]
MTIRLLKRIEQSIRKKKGHIDLLSIYMSRYQVLFHSGAFPTHPSPHIYMSFFLAVSLLSLLRGIGILCNFSNSFCLA